MLRGSVLQGRVLRRRLARVARSGDGVGGRLVPRRRVPRRRVAGERGSVLLAVMILFVMATTSAVLVQRNVFEARSAMRDEQRAEALGGADVGVAEATARIAYGETTAFSLSGTAGGAAYEVDAEPSAGGWSLTATGTAREAERTVAVTLEDSGTGWDIATWHETPG